VYTVFTNWWSGSKVKCLPRKGRALISKAMTDLKKIHIFRYDSNLKFNVKTLRSH
jgi:hypothetical protein